jgi:hypothetical protein
MRATRDCDAARQKVLNAVQAVQVVQPLCSVQDVIGGVWCRGFQMFQRWAAFRLNQSPSKRLTQKAIVEEGKPFQTFQAFRESMKLRRAPGSSSLLFHLDAAPSRINSSTNVSSMSCAALIGRSIFCATRAKSISNWYPLARFLPSGLSNSKSCV